MFLFVMQSQLLCSQERRRVNLSKELYYLTLFRDKNVQNTYINVIKMKNQSIGLYSSCENL